MKNTVIHTPHDKIFRSSLQYPEVAKEFLELYLPELIKKDLDFSTLSYCQTTFIDEELKLSQTDVLFKAKFKGNPAYLYILAEHESKVDLLIAFWLLKYMVAIWDYHIKQHAGSKALPLPVIIPLVFYTGGGEYTAERTFPNLFGDNSPLMQALLQAPFHLIEIDKLPEKAMTSHIFAGTLAFIMRKSFRNQLKQEIPKIIANLNALEDCEHTRFVVELLTYVFNLDEEHSTINELVGILKNEMSPAVEKDVMNLAEKLIEQGIEQGKIKLIQELLLNGVDPAFIAKNTKISLARVKDLQKKLAE